MLRTLASVFLLPPASSLLLILIGWFISRFVKWLGGMLILLGIASLWLLSTPIVSSMLHESIEQYPAFDPAFIDKAKKPQAIVVLGAAHRDTAAEYKDQATPVPRGLSRLHYAAWLQRETGLPIMTTGGPMNRGQDIHAEVLARALEVYSIDVEWVESGSATTWQNALFAADMLQPLGITDVLVVTQSYHMRRAVLLFELAGFNVTAAPTQLSTDFPLNVPRYWLPNTQYLDLSHDVLHEYLGLLWYSLVSPVDNAYERQVTLPAH